MQRSYSDNPTPHVGSYEATNPCGEQMLLPYEACVLGSVNLAKFVKTDTNGTHVDWDTLEYVVKTGVELLDRIIDTQAYPLPEIEAMHKGNRKVGVGVMGWADMLIALGIRYNSAEALELAAQLMGFITTKATERSAELAEDYGVFPNWKGSVWESKGLRVRNATLTTIAPTGTISIIAEVSSGIEPVFDFETIQRRAGSEFKVLHPLYRQWKENANGNGKHLPEYFVRALDIDAESHLEMQAAFQNHTHNAISKTINLPAGATKQDVANAYELAHRLGCKGITVYRDGSRKNQVISSSTGKKQLKQITPMELPEVRDPRLIELDTSEGKVYVFVTIYEDRPVEVFTLSPIESSHAEVYEALTRVVSISLRCGVPVHLLLHQLEDANRKYGSVVSPTYAMLRAFRKLGLNGEQDKCPECGSVIVLQEGCQKCITCGFSKC